MNEFIKEYIIQLLTYSPKNPLIFTGVYFWGFFAVVFAVFSVIHKRITLRNLFLFVASIFFYYKTSGLYFTLLLATIIYDYFIGLSMYKTQHPFLRKCWIVLSVTLNLFILAYFKYAYFFTDSYNAIFNTDYKVLNYFSVFQHTLTGSGSIIDKIILPIGISFYTFQSISYTVEIYRGKLKPLANIFDYGFFVAFFPPLVSGPIVRASEFIPQMLSKYHITGYQFGFAVFMILQGLLKKMVFGDYMAIHFIDKIYAAPETYPGFASLMAALCYSLQVYLDFSGYTDISIGVALLMGYRFMTNFNSPYKALNVADFWRRWHISLSTWLRDYLYIPLGGNRKGSWASYIIIALVASILVLLIGDYNYFLIFGGIALVFIILSKLFPAFKKQVDLNINLMITMLLGGLWHGSTWNFIIWGGINGLGLVVYKLWKKISPYEKLKGWYIRAFKIALTFLFVSYTRIWFRAPNKEVADTVRFKIFQDMDWSLADKVIEGYWKVFALFVVGMIVHWLPRSLKLKYRFAFIKAPIPIKLLAVVVTVFLIWQTVTAGFVPFIYFQF